MPRPARMSDVAKLARVSTMTVSRVLNENPNVLESTRKRVFAAVEQLSYRRNELARSLRERRSRQIGILVPNLYDPFFALCAHVVNGVAKTHGYSVNIATTDEDPEAEFSEASRMMLRHVEGLVVIPAEGGATGISRLLSPELEDLPMVTLDRPLQDKDRHTDALLVENKRGSHTGTAHLISLGHKRVAFVGLDRRLYTMRLRHNGYLSAMKEAGLEGVAIFVSGDPQTTQVELRKLLHGAERPTALFCGNNLLTRQVLHCLQRFHLRTPDDLALVGFDDFETADLLTPAITVVRQPIEALAQKAAEVLFDRLGENGSHEAGKRIVLPVELIVRSSCGSK